jgi:hypothetical protein
LNPYAILAPFEKIGSGFVNNFAVSGKTEEETAAAVRPTRLAERGRSDSNLFNDGKLRRG